MVVAAVRRRAPSRSDARRRAEEPVLLPFLLLRFRHAGNTTTRLLGRLVDDLIVRPIEVGQGAWLGAAAVLLGGVVVGANAIVGAGAVVAGDVAEATIVVGNPARPLDRKRVPGQP